jgi:hypothetical protein
MNKDTLMYAVAWLETGVGKVATQMMLEMMHGMSADDANSVVEAAEVIKGIADNIMHDAERGDGA